MNRAGLPWPQRAYAILALSCGTALVALDGYIANAVLPTIARELGVPASEAVLIVTTYQLVLVVALLPIGALADRIGHRRVFQGGQLLFLVATVGCVLAPNISLLLTARAGQALGAAGVLGVSAAMVRLIYPSAQLGRGLALNTVIVSSSAAAAPVIGVFILEHASWPWVFAAAAPPTLLSLILGRWLPKPKGGARKARYDIKGALLCATAMGTLIVGMESAVHAPWPLLPMVLIPAAVALSVYFARRELARGAPTVPLDLLARPIFALSMIGASLAFIGSMTVLTSLPFRLQFSYGLKPAEIGAVLALWPMAMMVCSPVSGLLTDRIHPGLIGGYGAVMATVGLTCLALLPDAPSFFDFAWRMILCGAGFGTFLPTNGRLVIGAAPHDRVASAGSMISTTRMIAQTIGATLTGALLAIGWGSGKLPAIIAAVLLAIATVCSFARLGSQPSRPDDDDLVAVPSELAS